MTENPPKLLSFVSYENPILRQTLDPISFPLSEEDRFIIESMKYSIQGEQLLKAGAPWEAAAGMAANQWGLAKRIFLYFDLERELHVVINPQYKPLPESEELLDWEGCFSVPLALGQIKRYSRILATYQNEIGDRIEQEFEGYLARVFQHETDHVNGFLYDSPETGKCLHKETFTSKEQALNFRGEKRKANSSSSSSE